VNARRRGRGAAIIVAMVGARLVGRLLIATPMLRDPNFDRTVVMLLDHNGDGALGVVLNRPSAMAVADPLPQWVDHVAEPAVVFVGGPVSPGSAICLAQARDEVTRDGWQPLFAGLGTIDLSLGPSDLGGTIGDLRVFAGYAGWGPGQLEAEIDAGAWYVTRPRPGDALCAEPEALWRAVLRRQGGAIAALATYPKELSVN
jgi:putative transcriptional regulator